MNWVDESSKTQQKAIKVQLNVKEANIHVRKRDGHEITFRFYQEIYNLDK